MHVFKRLLVTLLLFLIRLTLRSVDVTTYYVLILTPYITFNAFLVSFQFHL